MINRVLVCERFGWTFAEYDATDQRDLMESLSAYEGWRKGMSERKD